MESTAGILHCRTKIKGVMDVSSGRFIELQSVPEGPAYAFCGIGNPSAFFANLGKWGFSIAGRAEFPDHHNYKPDEITRLMTKARQAGAKALVTTEKDALNFPVMGKTEIPIFACLIQTEVLEAEAFEEALLERLQTEKVNV